MKTEKPNLVDVLLSSDYEPLEDFLKSRTSVANYNNIVPVVFTTKNRLTFVFKNPNKASFEEVLGLVQFILTDVSPKELILKTGIGADTLTINQLGKLGIFIA